jgi:hypothetical protein
MRFDYVGAVFGVIASREGRLSAKVQLGKLDLL